MYALSDDEAERLDAGHTIVRGDEVRRRTGKEPDVQHADVRIRTDWLLRWYEVDPQLDDEPF